MLALFDREFGEGPVELLDGQLFFIEFFGCFLPEEDMVFNAVPAVEGVVGFGTVTAQGDVVFLAHKLFQRVSYFVGNEKNGVLSLMEWMSIIFCKINGFHERVPPSDFVVHEKGKTRTAARGER